MQTQNIQYNCVCRVHLQDEIYIYSVVVIYIYTNSTTTTTDTHATTPWGKKIMKNTWLMMMMMVIENWKKKPSHATILLLDSAPQLRFLFKKLLPYILKNTSSFKRYTSFEIKKHYLIKSLYLTWYDTRSNTTRWNIRGILR